MYSKIERRERRAKREQVIIIAKFLCSNENELLARIAEFVIRQHELRTAIDAIVADLNGGVI